MIIKINTKVLIGVALLVVGCLWIVLEQKPAPTANQQSPQLDLPVNELNPQAMPAGFSESRYKELKITRFDLLI